MGSENLIQYPLAHLRPPEFESNRVHFETKSLRAVCAFTCNRHIVDMCDQAQQALIAHDTGRLARFMGLSEWSDWYCRLVDENTFLFVDEEWSIYVTTTNFWGHYHMMVATIEIMAAENMEIRLDELSPAAFLRVLFTRECYRRLRLVEIEQKALSEKE